MEAMVSRQVRVGFLLAGLCLLAACGRAETLLTVNASASTRSAPDMAIVTLGVAARGSSAQAAQQAQTARMASVMQAAQAAGVVDADVQTVGYSLEPQYVYARGAPPRITGYISRNTVSVRVKNLGAVSGLIDATVAEGANELQGIQFTYQDNEASRDQAREQALQTARRRAEAYAKSADMDVVRIDSITEPGGTVPEYRREGAFAPPPRSVSVEQSGANAIAPGQLDNQASVIVVFVLH